MVLLDDDLLQTPKNQQLKFHYFFVYIHPYPDGNGRIARFLMNVQLASDGICWCIIQSDDRKNYFQALENARIAQNIRPFAEFIKQQIAVKWFVREKRSLVFLALIVRKVYTTLNRFLYVWAEDLS